MASHLHFLFELYLSNQANAVERTELIQLLTDPDNEEEAKELLEAAWAEFEPKDSVFTDLQSRQILARVLGADIRETDTVRKPWKWQTILKVAAVLFLVFSIGFLLIKPMAGKNVTDLYATKSKKPNISDLRAPGDKAILTLADGTKIDLNDISKGAIANQSGINITKAADGQIVYTIDRQHLTSGTGEAVKQEYNTITTPRGGQFQINLPDGSKVWLNAASSLKFPTVFLNTERKVELAGEAYFEISSQEINKVKQPFRVISHTKNGRSQEIEVLGTHFNIQAYDNENVLKTTLLEGSVKVTNLNSNAVNILHPGQQSVLNIDKNTITQADTEEVMAWKNGNFVFNNMELIDILKQLERWYDLDIDYAHIPKTRYHGVISKRVTLTEVLNMLELTGSLKFKAESIPGSDSIKIEIVNK